MAKNQIKYVKKQFRIYETSKDCYVVHNTNKDFKDGHTHVGHDYGRAIYLVNLAFHRSIPKNINNERTLTSLIRISNNKVYIHQLQRLVDNIHEKRKLENT